MYVYSKSKNMCQNYLPIGKVAIVMFLPSASLPPGHFCLAVIDGSVAGHVMFHTSSCSKGHPPNAQYYGYFKSTKFQLPNNCEAYNIRR